MKMTKVQMAIEMMERDPSITQYRAAQLLGVSEAAISRARKLRASRGLCPHCGQLMPENPDEAVPSPPLKRGK